MKRPLAVQDLGRMSYALAYTEQLRLVNERKHGQGL